MENQTKTVNIIRWIARIWGTLVLLFVIFFLLMDIFGTGYDEASGALSPRDGITFIFFPLSTIVGLALAWKWEGLGGLITIVGVIGLLIVRPDLLSSISMIAGIAIPGILYLVYWYMTRRVNHL